MKGMTISEAIDEARESLQERRHQRAVSLLEQILERRPDHVEALCLSALAHWRGTGGNERAEELLERARMLAPGDARVWTLSAELSLRLGQLDAVRVFADFAIGLAPNHASAYVALARADASEIDDDRLKRMKALAADSRLSLTQRRGLWNGVGRVLDARDDVDGAFAAYVESNRLAATRYDRDLRERRLSEARTLFDAAFFERRRGHGVAGAGCVFVIGMPRSGSTLLEQALAAHPDIDSCGESDAMPGLDAALHRTLGAAAFCQHIAALDAGASQAAAKAYLAAAERSTRRADAPRRLDKRLSNFLIAPLIRVLLPDAPLLHAHRHPLDLCLSCFVQDFDGHAYANKLEDLAHYYRLYVEYLQMWSERMGEGLRHVRYERLARHPAAELRPIIDLLGVPWDDACARPDLAAGFVNTASAAQVREPAHDRQIGRWRAYERHLGPLINGLGGMAEVERLDRAFD